MTVEKPLCELPPNGSFTVVDDIYHCVITTPIIIVGFTNDELMRALQNSGLLEMAAGVAIALVEY